MRSPFLIVKDWSLASSAFKLWKRCDLRERAELLFLRSVLIFSEGIMTDSASKSSRDSSTMGEGCSSGC